ncbi:MAG: type II toxin-antitoxin system VapC family toxin [Limisphaerales bacterium]
MTASARIVVDTGPLVAALNAGDEHHAWSREVFGRLTPPVFTCEAVLSEAQFLLRERGGNPVAVLEWVRDAIIEIAFSAEDEIERLIELQRAYRNLPMAFADACLVRMTETHARSTVMTTDSDFRIFRRNRRQIIPLLAPPGI